MHHLQFSGYSKEERIKVYKKSRIKFQERQNNDISGSTPLYRSKFWNIGKWRKEKEQKRKDWYKKIDFLRQCHIKEKLARKCQSVFKECGLPIKVREVSGKSIKQHLIKPGPFKEMKCSNTNCHICLSSNNGINCKMRDIVYQHECTGFETCNGRYIGETSDSIKERTYEHQDNC